MNSLSNNIDTWIFDLDNTLYSADSGIFQQVHELMGKFVSNHLKIGINEAKEIQKKFIVILIQEILSMLLVWTYRLMSQNDQI